MSESDKSEEVLENVIEFDLPQHILEKYDLEQQVQLIKGYRYGKRHIPSINICKFLFKQMAVVKLCE